MAMHKLAWDDFYDADYMLLAIISPLQDYRLVYHINKTLGVGLSRCYKDLDVNYTTASFPLFEYHNKKHDTFWHLVGNIYKSAENQLYPTGTLFNTSQTVVKTHYLLPEEKAANYFLKVSNQISYINLETIIQKLKNIPQFITSYNVDISKIKHKDRIIF